MMISVRREELFKPLGAVVGVVERRHALPILANVLLRFDASELTLTATDLEAELRISVRGVSGESGELTVPARKLYDICRALPVDAKLDIRLERDKAIVKSGRSRFTLTTLPASEFPSLEAAQWQDAISLPQATLKRLLERAAFCMAQQDVRYYLNGLLLELSAQRVRAVATDGHRLALAEAAVEYTGSERQVIVPRKGVQEMLRLLTDDEAPVELRFSANHIRCALPNVTLTSKLIDGRFPDYHRVIPAKHTRSVRVDREGFREVLARVAILANEKYRGVRLSVSAGQLKLTAHNPEQEEAQEELSADYQGEPLEIGFNVNYLIDAANALSGATVDIGLTDADSSGTLRTPDDDQQLYVVMPMRL